MRIACTILLCLLATTLFAQVEGKSGGVMKPGQAIMDIRHYKIQLSVDPERKVSQEPLR